MKYYAAKINENGNIAIDDTLLVKDFPATAGSRILEGFKPLFNAEAVTRLENAGYTLSGKTHVGEFGLDLVGEFSYYAEKQEKLRGAAAELVANGDVKAALGVDVNGATRRAAALSDICFLKPTYGTVSRYGVISTAASGEAVGAYAKNTDGIKEIMSVIAGYDEKDGTSLRDKQYEYKNDCEISGLCVAVIKELVEKADAKTKSEIAAAVDALKEKGVVVEEISCSLFDIANTAWEILMTAETCNNISRYDGVKFGHRAKEYKNIDELYVNSRTEGFNFLTKAVILYGSDVLSKNRYADCYDKSLRVRRVVADGLQNLFAEYSAIIAPVCSAAEFAAYEMKDAFDKVFAEGEFTAAANLVGIPALACGKVQLFGKQLDESILLSLAHAFEKEGE
ncbi:MAG: hypothetical protein IJP33_00570 [Firmicutes bacterium]|nr:hypothetical protein [Bacillota bacterium]